MNTTQRLAAVLMLVPGLLTGCFDDPSTGESSTTSTGTETGDGDGDPAGDGDGDPTGDGDGDPITAAPPIIETFEINGSNPASTVEAAGAIVLRVVAADPNDDIERVEFEADGELVAFTSGAGPELEAEWLVSGSELNGTYSVTATVYDETDLASEPVSLELGIGMPEGGTEAESWFYDGGLLDSVYDVAVSPDGDQVLLAGQTSTMFGTGQRVDRVVGDPWTDKVKEDSFGAAGVEWAEGSFVVAGSLLTPTMQSLVINTAFYGFDAGGSIVETWEIDGSKPELGNPEIVDTPSGFVRDGDGRLFAIGTYTPQSGPFLDQPASYLLAVTASGEQEWLRWPSESPDVGGSPLLTEVAISADGELATIGLTGGDNASMWVGRWNTDGQLVSEIEAGADQQEGHALAFAPDGSLYVGGGRDSNGLLRSFVSRFDSNNEESWTDAPTQADEGVTAALAVDPWGELVSVSTEGCTDGGNGLSDCDLVVRKYLDDGTLAWEVSWEDETFSGPVTSLPGYDASIAIDRFGYIYVTAIVYTNNTGTDWWARKLHP